VFFTFFYYSREFLLTVTKGLNDLEQLEVQFMDFRQERFNSSLLQKMNTRFPESFC